MVGGGNAEMWTPPTRLPAPRRAPTEKKASNAQHATAHHTLFPLQEEAREVTGHADPLAAARAVLARPGARTRWCVVKEGGAGALLAERRTRSDSNGSSSSGSSSSGNGNSSSSSEDDIVHYQCPAMEVEVVDTVGCGDSFAAAIVAGFVGGHDPRGALALANAVGAATATGRGAGTNVADVATVEELLAAAAGGGGGHDPADIESARRLLARVRSGGVGVGGSNGSGGGSSNGSSSNGGAAAAGNGGGGSGGKEPRREAPGGREAAARAA